MLTKCGCLHSNEQLNKLQAKILSHTREVTSYLTIDGLPKNLEQCLISLNYPIEKLFEADRRISLDQFCEKKDRSTGKWASVKSIS